MSIKQTFEQWLESITSAEERSIIPKSEMGDLSYFFTEMDFCGNDECLKEMSLKVVPIDNERVRFNYFVNDSFLLTERLSVLNAKTFMSLIFKLNSLREKAEEHGIELYGLFRSEEDESGVYNQLGIEYFYQGENWISWIEIPRSTLSRPQGFSCLDLLEKWLYKQIKQVA